MAHRARKRFGQNFLHDPGIIGRIVQAIDPRPGQRMVEIGPGLGALTRHLLPALERLDVVELDRDLIPLLQEACGALGELQVHNVDALKFDFCSLGAPLRVVGNLPYNISTPLLFHLLEQRACVADMHFMLQKEVVDRLAARPGEPAYGRLGIMVQYHCAVERLFTVGPGAFHPAPKVDSAVVRLTPHAVPPVRVQDPQALQQVVRQAFSQRRKTLRNALKGLLDAADLEAAAIPPGERPERIGLEGYARLADRLSGRRA
ncbi:16S rRNA (adenine(1518)-N(6)/adenine(1519)-N(6))-dimethyltransferase RsmA [Ectothiorhodospiraceae bacterium 2226]|nr:16S rRNA (adenine(1518)-N(6)/adenine(1519)-N(6))-dimethyltransferase RsmA [Ectothiorhodospiraceae bacterium 2226]